MNEAIFISDLHLHPELLSLTTRFEQWVHWALQNTRSVYILGDFFHAWAGDDTLDQWSLQISALLAQFHQQQIPVYFMVGNRDFLLGQRFAEVAKVTMIREPKVVQFGDYKTLLVHGDRYCVLDKAHQWFRRVTRNTWFSRCFLFLPRALRLRIVSQVRRRSQSRYLPDEKMMVVPEVLGHEANQYQVNMVIHGHTHRPMRVQHHYCSHYFEQIVLSDWEEKPAILCYNESKAFHYLEYY